MPAGWPDPWGGPCALALLAVSIFRPIFGASVAGSGPDVLWPMWSEIAQREQGLAVDGTRSYGELTMTWLQWYYGIGLLGLAIVAVAIVVSRDLSDPRSPLWAIAIFMVLGGPLYLIDPNITPFQLWARGATCRSSSQRCWSWRPWPPMP